MNRLLSPAASITERSNRLTGDRGEDGTALLRLLIDMSVDSSRGLG